MDVVFLGHRRIGADRAAGDRLRARAGGRRSAPLRLRRGRAAPDAALHRARPGRRDLHHPLPRRPLPRAPRPAQDLRPQRPRTSRCASSARPGSIELFTALRRIFGRARPTRSSWSSSSPGEAVRHDGYEVRPFEVDHRMRGLRLRARRGRAPRPLRPRGRARGSGSPPAPTSGAFSGARRCGVDGAVQPGRRDGRGRGPVARS